MDIKKQILDALQNPDFPDLKFLYSPEVLAVSEEILWELLVEEQEDFQKKLKIPDEDISFETFEDFSILDYFFWLLEHYQWVNNDEVIRKIIENFEPKYIDFSNEVAYSKRYYEMLKYCFQNGSLDAEQKRIMEKSVEVYEIRGIALAEAEQAKLKKINKDLSELGQNFWNNVLDSQKEFEYMISNEDIISEMPDDDKLVAKKKAEEKKREWYLFDASQSAYAAIMKYCSDKSIRAYFYTARNLFATEEWRNNKTVILKILELKNEKAKLLGFPNYAELSLHFKMAETPDQIIDLFGEISEKARPKAQAELNEIREYFNLQELVVSDLSYYARKLREEKYALDDKELKKYFEFEKVLEWMFEIVKRLYGIEIKKIQPHPNPLLKEREQTSEPLSPWGERIQEWGFVWEGSIFDDIQVYEVSRNGKFLSYFFTDFFYRPFKRQWAWANILRENFRGNKKIVLNVCNFQKWADGTTLLTLWDVETMFHEFGHATHEMLSRSEHSELSGFHVEWDFVELPSQLLENWCRDPEGMKIFASHYQTWEPVPEDILQKLEQLDTFGSGQFVIKQNEYAMMDMSLHTGIIPSSESELDTHVQKNYLKNSLFPLSEVYNPHTSFSHIFDGGYAAGYYSYMWAEIIEKEVWRAFKDSGDIFSPEVSKKFHDTILSQGTTKKASELFRDFFNRDVEIDAFLSEKGLI